MSRTSQPSSIHAPAGARARPHAALVATLLALAVACAVALILWNNNSSAPSSERVAPAASSPAFVSHPEEGTRGPDAVVPGRPDGGPDEGTRGLGH